MFDDSNFMACVRADSAAAEPAQSHSDGVQHELTSVVDDPHGYFRAANVLCHPPHLRLTKPRPCHLGKRMSTTEAVRSERGARDKGRRTGSGRTENRRLSEWAGVPRGGSGAAHTYIFPRTLSVDTFKSLERLEAREREPPSEDELELMAFLSEERDSHSSPHSSLHKSGAKDSSTQVT